MNHRFDRRLVTAGIARTYLCRYANKNPQNLDETHSGVLSAMARG